MNKRTAEIIIGYLPNLDGDAPAAVKYNLPSRTALVIRAISEEELEPEIGRRHVLGVIGAVANATSAEHVRINFDNKFEKVFKCPSNIIEQIIETRPNDFEAPIYAEFERDFKISAIIHFAPWSIIGLDPPYDDSYVIEVFSLKELEAEIESEIGIMSSNLGRKIEKRWVGAPHPPGRHIDKFLGPGLKMEGN